jgi:hypothetical protein
LTVTLEKTCKRGILAGESQLRFKRLNQGLKIWENETKNFTQKTRLVKKPVARTEHSLLEFGVKLKITN